MASPYVVPGIKRDKQKLVRYPSDQIVEAVKAIMQISSRGLFTRGRDQPRMTIRQMTTYLLYYYAGPTMSLKAIGQFLVYAGKKPYDHTTVLHNVNLFKDLLATEDRWKENLNRILHHLASEGLSETTIKDFTTIKTNEK